MRYEAVITSKVMISNFIQLELVQLLLIPVGRTFKKRREQ